MSFCNAGSPVFVQDDPCLSQPSWLGISAALTHEPPRTRGTGCLSLELQGHLSIPSSFCTSTHGAEKLKENSSSADNWSQTFGDSERAAEVRVSGTKAGGMSSGGHRLAPKTQARRAVQTALESVLLLP